MSRRILVLDAFTNGHEAARAFIERQGWEEEACEVVFCGTHANILQQLTVGPAYAVLPVHNSIAGEVTEVTEPLAWLRDMGYELVERDRAEQQIDHCLLAPPHIAAVAELDRVISHEKAIQQCGEFLDSIGIDSDKRSKRDSTGNAARALATMGPQVKIGAIAPKAAAEEYGLKILAEAIQDRQDNKTTFVLLENKSVVEPVTVGIIGQNGRFGKMLTTFFASLGCKVIGCGRSIRHKRAVVREADVVIFSVPIDRTPDIIRSVVPDSREDQLWMDVTSIKGPAVAAMLESRAQVVGLHPMFRPEVPFTGQTVVACPARLTQPQWMTWVVNMLAATGSDIKWSTPTQHDQYMTTVQVMPHLGNLASAVLVARSGVDVTESLAFTSPFYRLAFSAMGRLVSQSPDLYTSIVFDNPEAAAMLADRIAIERELLRMIKVKDRRGFEALFRRAKDHFGPAVTKEANELFTRIIAMMATLYGRDSVILEFHVSKSEPGLLARICSVFQQHQVNLTGINSVLLDGQRQQFTISFEQARMSGPVRDALEEIQSWRDLRVKVLD